MSDELPPGWVETTLEEVVSRPRSKVVPSDYPDLPFIGMDHIAQDGMELLGSVPFGKMKSSGGMFFEGDVLYGRMRPYLNKVHRSKTKGACSAEFIVLPKSEAIDSDFLAYTLHHRKFVNFASEQSSGDRPRVDFDALSNYELSLPPKSEQSRIVSKIEELFSRIDEGERALERVQKLVERYRQSVLKTAVTGELTREWREKQAKSGAAIENGEALLARILTARREAWEQAELGKMKAKGIKPKDDKWKQKYEQPAPPSTSELPELPEGWAWASFPQLGVFGRGKSKHRPRNDPKLYGGQYPFLQTGAIRASNGRIDAHDTTYNEIGLAQSKLWPKGTICITIAANIAASGILQFDSCFPDSVVGLTPSPDIIGEYIEFFVRTERASLDRYAPATAQKNINLEILERVAVPLPPLEEQRVIYSKAQEELSKIDDIERTLVRAAVESNALRQATLKAAFLGQLVTQDPTDEPAIALLERIATERAAAPAKPKRSPKIKKKSTK